MKYRIKKRTNYLDESTYLPQKKFLFIFWRGLSWIYEYGDSILIWLNTYENAIFYINKDIEDTKRNTFKTQEIIKYEKV